MHTNTLDRHVMGASYQRTFCNGRLQVVGIGKYFMDEVEPDWTFRNLGVPTSPSVRYLPIIAHEMDIREILAPSPVAFNGLLIEEAELTTWIQISDIIVKRNPKKPADILCKLPTGKAFAISAAGCALLTGWTVNPNTGEVLNVGVAHMGLVSLLNNVGGNLLTVLGDSPVDTYFHIDFAISSDILTYPWDDPERGGQNKARCIAIWKDFGSEAVPGFEDSGKERNKGRVSITAMAYAQLTRLGVRREHIQASSPLGADSPFYTTRDGSDKRNLVIVARHA